MAIWRKRFNIDENWLMQNEGAAGWRRLVNVRLFRLAMRLRDDDHRSRLARTRRHRTLLRRHRTLLRRRSRTLRSRAGDNGRIAVAVMVVVVMAADGGEGQGSGDQQGEEFTHGHVSFLFWGNDNGWICFCVFSLSLPTNIIGEWNFLIYFIKKTLLCGKWDKWD